MCLKVVLENYFALSRQKLLISRYECSFFNCSPVTEIVVSPKNKFLTKFSKIENNGLCSLFRNTALCELRGA